MYIDDDIAGARSQRSKNQREKTRAQTQPEHLLELIPLGNIIRGPNTRKRPERGTVDLEDGEEEKGGGGAKDVSGVRVGRGMQTKRGRGGME